MNRRGTTLLELVAALTLSLGLMLLVWGLLATAQARLRSRSERSGLTHALRVAEGALRSLSSPLAADLEVAAPDRLVARVVRAAAVACGVSPLGVTVRTGAGWWRAVRVPVPGRDSLLAGTLDSASRWIPAALQAEPRAESCPDGGSGLLLPARFPDSLAARLGVGSPVHVVEPVELRLYRSAAGSSLGARLVATGESVQPIGPVGGSSSDFEFLSRTGAPAPVPAGVALIRWTLRAETDRAMGVGVARGGATQHDSTVVAVLLRNSP